jgi:hypothetical protein
MKNLNRILSILVSLVTISAFLFISDFTRATRGWFRPSSDNVSLTLAGILVISLLFIFYGYRFNRICVTYIIFSVILFVAYFGFLLTTPSANMIEGGGIILSLTYGIGKYGSFLVGAFVLIKLLTKQKENIFS